MNWNKAVQRNWSSSRMTVGFDVYPYQVAFGASLRYLSCIPSIMFRLYLGSLKLWGNVHFKAARAAGKEER